MHVNQIAEEMFRVKHEKMSTQQSEIFLNMWIAERLKDSLPKEIIESFPFQVMKKRLVSHYGKQVATDSVLAFLSIGVASSVGEVVMYAGAVAAMYAEHHGEHIITMEDVADKFAMGFPSKDTLEVIWEMQKIGGDNSLDRSDMWPVVEETVQ